MLSQISIISLLDHFLEQVSFKVAYLSVHLGSYEILQGSLELIGYRELSFRHFNEILNLLFNSGYKASMQLMLNMLS
jgi:hypothetical protein